MAHANAPEKDRLNRSGTTTRQQLAWAILFTLVSANPACFSLSLSSHPTLPQQTQHLAASHCLPTSPCAAEDDFPYYKGFVTIVMSWFMSPIISGGLSAIIFIINRSVGQVSDSVW